MEPARTLKALWRRRRLVTVGVGVAAIAALLGVFRVGLFPPTFQSRTNVFATASTEILIDTSDSAYADLTNDIEPLGARAGVFARFLASPAAISLIAHRAMLPRDAIEAEGPYDQGLPEAQQVPTAEKRSSQILGERALYRMRFENTPELPVVSVFAQAPTPGEAIRLAQAAPAALRDYVERIQARQGTPVSRKIEIRRLGRAIGGTVNEGANLQIAVLVFVVVFALWCLLSIPARTVARGWREADAREDARRRSGNGNGDGHVVREEVVPWDPELDRVR